MNTSQMMITIGALFLLSLVILRVTRGFLNTDEVLLDNKLGVLAVSVASSLLEEASGKAFDENTDSATVSSLSGLSTTLGPDGEVYPHFNDIDDYNGFKKIDNSIPAARFVDSVSVVYVSDANLNVPSASKTWNKKITVFVSSPSLLRADGKPDTIKMSQVFSYWYFR